MLGSGSSIFMEADDYQAHLLVPMDLLVVQPGRFRAHLTWVGLPQLHLLHARMFRVRRDEPPREVAA